MVRTLIAFGILSLAVLACNDRTHTSSSRDTGVTNPDSPTVTDTGYVKETGSKDTSETHDAQPIDMQPSSDTENQDLAQAPDLESLDQAADTSVDSSRSPDTDPPDGATSDGGG
jgi:hypothetical protein